MASGFGSVGPDPLVEPKSVEGSAAGSAGAVEVA
jgi:hypothetical protein